MIAKWKKKRLRYKTMYWFDLTTVTHKNLHKFDKKNLSIGY